MKAILEFNLDDRDERMAHLRCVHALDLALTIYDVERILMNDHIEDNEVKLERISEIIRSVNLSELIE